MLASIGAAEEFVPFLCMADDSYLLSAALSQNDRPTAGVIIHGPICRQSAVEREEVLDSTAVAALHRLRVHVVTAASHPGRHTAARQLWAGHPNEVQIDSITRLRQLF